MAADPTELPCLGCRRLIPADRHFCSRECIEAWAARHGSYGEESTIRGHERREARR